MVSAGDWKRMWMNWVNNFARLSKAQTTLDSSATTTACHHWALNIKCEVAGTLGHTLLIFLLFTSRECANERPCYVVAALVVNLMHTDFIHYHHLSAAARGSKRCFLLDDVQNSWVTAVHSHTQSLASNQIRSIHQQFCSITNNRLSLLIQHAGFFLTCLRKKGFISYKCFHCLIPVIRSCIVTMQYITNVPNVVVVNYGLCYVPW